ncbi:FAD-binding oxidoreductase [Nocardiopsis quinghaiensis]|uniref:FAD-binding oxidoreductase n=1 Tax=Nocardiopsis quinghaiensis TaxID=464995 RepID=UPI00123870DA|nr:FAD-binding protein [Nocardiopsis quinghaiensis]
MRAGGQGGDRSPFAFPGSHDYGTATRVFNLLAPARPSGALTATTPEEVGEAVRYARRAGSRLRVHSTGHAAAVAAPMEGQLLVRARMSERVEVDPDRRVARVPAGALWGEVVDAAAPHGLAAPHGSSANVGAVGYLLRGGVSFYSRRHGLASNGVRAVELVTADGRSRRVDEAHDPEILWALRGGGGGFGVVTAVEVSLFPVRGAVAGAAFWEGRHLDRLLETWTAWARGASEDIMSSLRVMRFPRVPDVPEELSSGPVVCVDGAVPYAGDERAALGTAHDLLGPLRDVAAPITDTWAPVAVPEVIRMHMDPPEPVPILGDHMLLEDLDEAGVRALIDLVGPDSGSPLVAAGLRQLGGSLARPHPGGGALDHLDAAFVYSGAGAPLDGVTPGALSAHCARVRSGLARWDTGTTAPTFVETREQPQRHLTPDRVERLDRLREELDPTGLFHADITPNATFRDM